MSRSHLIPEPRTNKNGVTSVKWVAPDETAPASTKRLPAPGVVKQRALEPHEDNEVMIGLVYGSSESDVPRNSMPEIMDVIRQDDPTVLPFVHELLTTGTKTGQLMVKAAFRDDVSGIAGALSERGRDENWMDMCSWGTDITSAAMRGWSCGNVLEESGLEVTESLARATRNGVYKIDSTRMAQDGWERFGLSPTNTEYWRGVTALKLSGSKNTMLVALDGEDMDFIEWAGKHDDIALVISTAMERRTINVETLKHITDNDSVISEMREGIL
jgi:hypothetical protein